MSRGLVIVNYHSAALTARAILTARAASTTPLRIVVVDNSSDQAEWEALHEAGADELLRADENPGYGSAANLGAQRLDDDVLLVANADVEFFPGAIDALAGELEAPGVVLTGPRFVWDSAGEWLLPPPDLPSGGGALLRALAGRSAAVEAAWRRRRRLARMRFWTEQAPHDARALSGAVLCLRRDAFVSVGGFDPLFRLYFEEIDLMMRLRERGGAIRHVPAARVRHLYNQSGRTNPQSGVLYAESERVFYRKWLGSWGLRLLRWRTPLRNPRTVAAGEPPESIVLPAGEWVIEASPLPDFGTAAGRFWEGGEIVVADEIVRSLSGSPLWVQPVDRRTGRGGAVVKVV